jgi:hypothetical protein
VIALQIHAGMRGTIRYRNLQITEFPPLLRSDFRLSADAEGWQGSAAPDASETTTSSWAAPGAATSSPGSWLSRRG